jgi:hypothetical protein
MTNQKDTVNMRLSHQLLAAASLFALSSTVFAASQDEANQVKSAIEKYITAEPGVVTVAVAGDAYDLTIDVNPFLAKAKKQGFDAKVSPLAYKVKSLGGGKWQIDQNQVMTFKMDGGAAAVIDYKLDGLKFTGIFDEAMTGFESNSYEITSLEAVQNINDPVNKTRQLTNSKVTGFKGQQTSVLNASGGIDFKGGYSAGATASDSKIEGPNGAFSFAYTAAETTSDYSATNFRQREFLALMAWFVARPSPDLIKKDQNELRTLVKATLPLFDTIKASGQAGTINVTTQFGNGSLAGIDFEMDMNGATKDGKFREAVNFKGLTFPDGILPPWSKSLLPTDMSMDFAITGYNAADLATLVVDNFNLNTEPPLTPEIQAQLLGKALPSGAIAIALNPGTIKAASYEISYEGNLNVVLTGPPAGKATLKMRGFDQTIQALQEAAATDPSVNQVIGPLMAAKGFSKQDGDTLVWALESTPEGGVLVNGVDLTKMGAP